jgi:hypothetical protein
MSGPQLSDVWTAAGVLLGLQGVVFTGRIRREVEVGDQGGPTWLAVADMVNLASVLTIIGGVFVLPIFIPNAIAKYALGLAVTLFAGHLIAVAGHYELYNPSTSRSADHFPRQERIVVWSVAAVAVVYVFAAILYAISN